MASILRSSARSPITAPLHRFVQLGDRMSTHVLTFIVPSQLYRGFIPEVHSKDFLYGHQQWNLRFVRTDRHVGVYLVLRSALSGMTVRVDFNIAAINRVHFTRNENYGEKAAEFSASGASHGCGIFIELSDLLHRHFLFDDQKFLIELELRNPTTLFSELIEPTREVLVNERFETTYFTFGCCDWNLLVTYDVDAALGDTTTASGHESRHLSLTLNRHTRLDHRCRIRYRVKFVIGDSTVDSGVIDQHLDVRGYGREQHIGGDAVYKALTNKEAVLTVIELYIMYSITLIDVCPTSRAKNVARLYDNEKQEWVAETDILGKVVSVKLFYADINNVQRGHSRLVCFNVSLVPHDHSKPLVRALTSPYCLYYSQREADEGHEIAFNLPVEEICDTASGYVDPETGSLNIQFEWIYSHLLYRDHYHHYDNIGALHKHQMSREILALQSENYALEKQVHSYQQFIAKKEAAALSGEPNSEHFRIDSAMKSSSLPRGVPAASPPDSSNGHRVPNSSGASRRPMTSVGGEKSHNNRPKSPEPSREELLRKLASAW